jgi:UDP-N-acetylglucosamine 2-epimerase (non-hydrolysing)
MSAPILVMIGTRPEAIKLAPVIQEILGRPHLNLKVCRSSQHQELVDGVLDCFDIQVDYDLEVMSQNQSLSLLTSSLLAKVDRLLDECTPSLVLVHGDTTTAFATALACFYKGIPVGHIEAGLRSHNIRSPFPEEANRVFISKLATLHFCPTPSALVQLREEGVSDTYLHMTGNTIVDALHMMTERLTPQCPLVLEMTSRFLFLQTQAPFILVTSHRREHFGEGILQICEALKKVASQYPDLPIVFPVHLNPQIYDAVHQALKEIPTIYLLPPQDYPSFVYLMSQCTLILTDSGGIQEEASVLRKPVLVMRDNTERPDSILAGISQLVGTDPNRILSAVSALLDRPSDLPLINATQTMSLYGEVGVSKRIVDIIEGVGSGE